MFIQALKGILDGGHRLLFPDGILINGRGPNGASFTVEQGKILIARRIRNTLLNSVRYTL